MSKKLPKAARKALAKQQAGMAAFHEYYSGVYGPRWSASLYPALKRPVRMAALLNRYVGEPNLQRLRAFLRDQGAAPTPGEWWSAEAAGRGRPAAATALPINDPAVPLSGAECWWFPCDMQSGAAAAAATVNAADESGSSATPVSDNDGETVTATDAEADTDEADAEIDADAEADADADVDDPTLTRFPPPTTFRTRLDPSSTLDPLEGLAMPLPFYPLDLASVMAVRAMGLRGGERVLDLCAAPGGKSLAIAQYLHLETARARPYITSAAAAGAADPHAAGPSLTCNDPSPPRRERLKLTLKQYLPYAVAANPLRNRVKGLDPTRVQANKIEQD